MPSTESTNPGTSPPPADTDDPVEATRMSFGDHLEELRARLILALVGVGVCGGLALIFGQSLLAFLCRPLLAAQYDAGLQPSVLALAPTTGFLAYFKISLLAGLLAAMPWVLYQLWMFVAAGLYPHEKRFVVRLLPGSIGLFALGVAFLYILVLPLVLGFLISWNRSISLGDVGMLGRLSHTADPVTPADEPRADESPAPRIPLLTDAPAAPRPGDVWVDTTRRRLMFQTNSGVLSAPLEVGGTAVAMQSQFALDQYLSFVLLLMLAFGVAFQTPIVVYFLIVTGIVPYEAMARARRYVVIVMLVVAAVLTPPDVVSQLLLAIPMYLLYEAGMLAARPRAPAKDQGDAKSSA